MVAAPPAGLAHDSLVDGAPAFFSQGYTYVSNRCDHLGTDAFETRFLGKPAVFTKGPEAARAFYDHRLTRAGAMPVTAFSLLQDKGSVAALDGEAHHRRKALFLAIAGPDALAPLLEAARAEWDLALSRFARADHVVLLPAVEELLCRAACAWAGVPLGEPEAHERAVELGAMIDGSGSAGVRNLRGHLARRRAEAWAAGLVEAVRAGTLEPPPASALAAIARYEGPGGQLTPAAAAVELINVLRPTVAVARYVVFEALALHDHPEAPTDDATAFAHEVRRFYPFFPVVAGRVVEPFDWHGAHFPEGRRVMLDLYGTNHDRRAFDEPEAFRPERFADGPGDPYRLIPQGGGDHDEGHRCPGEWATLALMEQALGILSREVTYEVPDQDLEVRLSRMPAQPESRFVIRSVRRR